jgi:hypothetical protein
MPSLRLPVALAAIFALIVGAQPVLAGVISQSSSFGPFDFSNPVSTNLSFNPFNTSLGTLTNVTATVTLDGTITLKASTTHGVTYSSAQATAAAEVSGPDGLSPEAFLEAGPVSGHAGSGSVTLASDTGPVTNTADALASDFSLYEAGSVTLHFTGFEIAVGSYQPVVDPIVGGTVSGSVELDYTYSPPVQPPPSALPEPPSVTLIGVALAGLGFLRRRVATGR